MFLERIRLQRFRSCDDVTIKLQPDLTVLVGENNGGKSNIVDGIRLLTLPLSGRRDRYAEDEDLRRGPAKTDFRIEGQYSGLSQTLKGLLVRAVPDPTVDLAIFGMRYQPKSADNPRGRPTWWAGKFDTVEPEPGSSELIRHVYLPPLRDAQHALGSGSATRINALLQHFLEKGEEREFLEFVRRKKEPHRVITAVNTEIGGALGMLSGGIRPQAASLGFSSENLFDVARDLRFMLADAGLGLEEIRSSGLGYANLLFVATAVVELTRAKDADLTLFLVEEPEAHLHPQLQMLVLEFLLEQAQKSFTLEPRPGQPEGRIQVIVTSHSPNLTAWVSPKHLVVVRSQQDTSTMPPTRKTAAVSIEDLGLSEASLDKISRYLDVTRSALLFGNRAMLVEGIAESLLIPVIAKHIVLKGKQDAWLRFRGSIVVPIDGVDFKPYVEVLLSPKNGARIADLVVVVTDADPTVPGNRKLDLEKLASDFGSASNLRVLTNQQTLEQELFAAGNERVLKEAFLALHPNSEADWSKGIESVSEGRRPGAFVELLKKKRTRKGDLAQQIASWITSGTPFAVPKYLQDAIEAIAAP